MSYNNKSIQIKKETRYLIINNLVGLGLASIAVTSFTAGVFFEVIIMGLIIGTPFLFYKIIKQTNLIIRVVIIVLLGLQFHSFMESNMAENFHVSFKGYLISDKQIEYYKWLAPISASICLTSFWAVLINSMKKKQKTLPNR
jgi:hypothetical protein